MQTKVAVKIKSTTKEKLSLSLAFGPVELNVKDLKMMKDYYVNVVGLEVIAESSDTVKLGKNKKPLLILHKRPDLSLPFATEAGLYHFAIVFGSRVDLARTVYQILQQAPQSFSGSADHLVSEAFYFTDPEGNGIELYFDRDRNEWQWENNQIKMATLYIDPADYIQRHLKVKDKNTNIQMGHVHLKVGDIEKAKQFYVEILGFDIIAELSGALFISVGGYHHHIGLNTWESLGANKRRETLGLKQFEFILPTIEDLDSLRKRLEKNNIIVHEKDNAILFSDPWNNQIKVKV